MLLSVVAFRGFPHCYVDAFRPDASYIGLACGSLPRTTYGLPTFAKLALDVFRQTGSIAKNTALYLLALTLNRQ